MIEVMISILILTISLLGISSAYVAGRRQIIKQGYYQQAVHLATQKIEELKAAGYSGIAAGELQEELDISGIACTRYSKVELTATPSPLVPKPCKLVTVTMQWTGDAEDDHQIKLVTYIGP